MKKLSIILSIAIISFLSIWYYQANKITISVIVPVYNSEKYINHCLDSILKQKGNFEIVIVDDGSTDSTPQILKEYQKNNSNIKLITQKNEGVSSARNKGLKASTSKYITFVDSDDWLEPNAFEKSINVIKKDSPDILLASHYDVYDKEWVKNTRGEEEAKNIPEIRKFPSRSLDKISLFSPFQAKEALSDLYYVGTGVRGVFFRRGFIKKHNIDFPLNITCGEDDVFLHRLFMNNPLISVITQPIYNYRNRTDSLAKSIKALQGSIEALNFLQKTQEYKASKKQVQMFIQDTWLSWLFLSLANYRRHNLPLDAVIKEANSLYKDFEKYNITERKSLRNYLKLHKILYGNIASPLL